MHFRNRDEGSDSGCFSQMDTFEFYFSILAEIILRTILVKPFRILSWPVHKHNNYEIAMLTVKTLQSIHTEANFDLFWEKWN